MLVEQRRARRLEEDQAAARNRRRLVEPEGPVRQARTRIDQEGMILAEGRKRRPGEWQGNDPGQEQRTPGSAQQMGDAGHGFGSRPSRAAMRCSSSAVASGTPPARTASATSPTRPLLPMSWTAAPAPLNNATMTASPAPGPPAGPRGNALLQFGSRVGHSTRKDRLGHQHHAAILAHVLDRRLGRLEIGERAGLPDFRVSGRAGFSIDEPRDGLSQAHRNDLLTGTGHFAADPGPPQQSADRE